MKFTQNLVPLVKLFSGLCFSSFTPKTVESHFVNIDSDQKKRQIKWIAFKRPPTSGIKMEH